MRNIIRKGYLDVPGGHKIYFEEWGNPSAPVMFYLHGGPGAGFKNKNKRLFDPQLHHVVFHDQRGAGRSLPYASTKNNTTQDLIEDISRLADHLGIKKFSLVGGSWGSTLCLLYAIAYPNRVHALYLWSIYLIRKAETDYVNQGVARYWFPEEWDRFISFVPEEQRKTGDTIMKFYAEKIRSKDREEAKKYANEWTLWEATLISINYTKEIWEAMVLGNDNTALATLETHYFMQDCFVPDNYILNNILKIKHIPLYIVQGRFDMCTPPFGAQKLFETYGENAFLTWTRAGHLRSDPENAKAIKKMLHEGAHSRG